MSKIKITYPFIIGISVLVFLDIAWLLVSVIFAMFIHETGNIVGLLYKKIQ